MKTALTKSAALFALTFAVTGVARAQDWPSKPIRVIQPSASGVSTDTVARAILKNISDRTGWTMIVENRPGGEFIPSTTAVTGAPRDGYTVLNLVQSVTIVPFSRKDVPFDLRRDLAPVTLLGTIPLAMVIHPSLPARNLTELIAHSKANPGKLNYAVPGGTGTSGHLTGEYVKLATGLDMAAVPYKDTSTAYADLYENRVQIAISAVGNWIQGINAGKLRPIAVTSQKRDASAPNIPTLIELTGNKALDLDSWVGWAVPAGTPRPIIDRLHREYQVALQSKELREQMIKLGITPGSETPEEFGQRVEASLKRWERVIREVGIQFK